MPSTVGFGCWPSCNSTAEQVVSRAASDIVNAKEVMSVCVGDWRKIAWSRGVRMRRAGCVKLRLSACGVCGNGGVGIGVLGDDCEGSARCLGGRSRGVSFGSFFDRSGGVDGIAVSGNGSGRGCVIADGMVEFEENMRLHWHDQPTL